MISELYKPFMHPMHLIQITVHGLQQNATSVCSRMQQHPMLTPCNVHSSTHNIPKSLQRIIHYDLLVIGSNVTLIAHMLEALRLELPITDLGNLHFFLGIEATYSPNGLLLTQWKYISDLLARTNMSASKPIKTPMLPRRNSVCMMVICLRAHPCIRAPSDPSNTYPLQGIHIQCTSYKSQDMTYNRMQRVCAAQMQQHPMPTPCRTQQHYVQQN
ncbi:hypothetical protein F2P56_026351 [Juglans regia]|uniref:Reverse transcriptase Ty1/copia-type domain-containing protein n=1 Tax=Juglans regia TaxID=51240 RepID=A0A833T1X1_JUGRE|nr:hypothetical protein F2P56_026351 [Juglans regia]